MGNATDVVWYFWRRRFFIILLLFLLLLDDGATVELLTDYRTHTHTHVHQKTSDKRGFFVVVANCWLSLIERDDLRRSVPHAFTLRCSATHTHCRVTAQGAHRHTHPPPWRVPSSLRSSVSVQKKQKHREKLTTQQSALAASSARASANPSNATVANRLTWQWRTLRALCFAVAGTLSCPKLRRLLARSLARLNPTRTVRALPEHYGHASRLERMQRNESRTGRVWWWRMRTDDRGRLSATKSTKKQQQQQQQQAAFVWREISESESGGCGHAWERRCPTGIREIQLSSPCLALHLPSETL